MRYSFSVPLSTVRSVTPASLYLICSEQFKVIMVVSRAEYKIENASNAFHFVFKDKIVLDIGSSTGGFTEYALLKGAEKVIAVEKGTKQMKAPLRFNPKIELHEKTDIFEFRTDERIDVILADVSFVSLKKVLAYAKRNLARGKTEFLVMLKPQFEAEERQLFKGVVKNERIRRDIIKDFEQWLQENGFIIKNKRDNTLAGKNGNLERFYYMCLAKK
ncbi:TlyA family RNA methyltransferase [Candidatus Saccharibacteria bacterium]|nr:TlyA family RNA methyltransferase [Candidatus Saccharibacteria bacterium]